jgi:hypothetical protein
MNAALVLSKTSTRSANAANAVATSLMAYCMVCNTPQSAAAFATGTALVTRSASTLVAQTFQQQHSVGCHCVSCSKSRGLHSITASSHGATCTCGSCQLKMSAHSDACGCASCSAAHGPACGCTSCNVAATHGPGCVCSGCRM